VKLRDVHDAQETLGVYSCPAGDFAFHIECKMEKGKKWVLSNYEGALVLRLMAGWASDML
jgi:hypothetical protein